MFLIAFFSIEASGHEIDLTINGNDYLVEISQSGLGNHNLDLILYNPSISMIEIIQEGDGPWSITVDGTTQNWPDAVEIGGICNAIDGCTLTLE